MHHINAVDAVTPSEIVGCAARISEQHLLTVLEAMLDQFPFRIPGFHTDNGSEFVNHTVAKMLNQLLVEFTRSRPNRSSDNTQVEGKDGAIVRKHMGYGHIASAHTDQIQRFYTAHFNPYLNYHRPCGFAQVGLDDRAVVVGATGGRTTPLLTKNSVRCPRPMVISKRECGGNWPPLHSLGWSPNCCRLFRR